MKKEILIKELDALKNTYNFRQLKECNNSLVNLSSNDYLGLASRRWQKTESERKRRSAVDS